MEVAGGVLRYMHDSNWKMFVENLNDAMHPMAAHEFVGGHGEGIVERPAGRCAEADGDRAIGAFRRQL